MVTSTKFDTAAKRLLGSTYDPMIMAGADRPLVAREIMLRCFLGELPADCAEDLKIIQEVVRSLVRGRGTTGLSDE